MSEQELIEENATLRKQVSAQGILIYQQRATIEKLQHLKVAIVAGKYADEVDLEAEVGKQVDLHITAAEEYQKMLEAMKAAAEGKDGGKSAKEFLKSVGAVEAVEVIAK